MKFSVFWGLLGLVAANPTSTWDHAVAAIAGPQGAARKAIATDKANIGFAMLNGGTTGGSGGTVTTVSTLAQFTAAVGEKNKEPTIVFVQGAINGSAKVRVGSNKTIIGLAGSKLNGVGLLFRKQKNLIIRNIVSSSVVAANGDALTIDASSNVWVDHCDFSSAKGSDKDFYDGLVDVTHGSDFVTISHTYFHDHWKTSLVGHSDSNAKEDKGHLRVTYANNHWKNCGSRGPSLRFGTGHIYNSFYEDMSSAINTRMGAQVLAESNAFKNVNSPITSADSKEQGYAVAVDNDLGGATNRAPGGTMATAAIPYQYSRLGSGSIAATIPKEAGAILAFDAIPATNGTAVSHHSRVRAAKIGR